MENTAIQNKTAPGRGSAGRRGSIVGICVNLFLSAAKFLAGTLAGSISITGDAVNNLTDAASSVISLFSFKVSEKPADKKHPFGHARIEYIASSVVAFIILMVAIELVKSSVGKIIAPSPAEFSLLSIGVLIFSILAKLWLNRFYIRTGKQIDSPVMQAAAADSLSDVLTTSTVLISTVLSPILRFQLDGYMGVGVALFIAWSGIQIVKTTVDHLIGKEPSEELTAKIEAYIRKYPGVLRIHDLMVHDYGPQRCFASVHVEVDAGNDILESHDLIDNIEHDIARDMDIHLVIHMDPIVTDDPYVDEMFLLAERVVLSVNSQLTIHDFRVVKGTTHSNLIFDVVVPYTCKKCDEEIMQEINLGIHEISEALHIVVTLDRAYVASRPMHNYK